MTRAVSALLLLTLVGCETASGVPEPIVPSDHPCPEWALAPTDAALWWDHVDRGEPAPLALALPLPPGLAAQVSQGNLQGPTHEGDNAWAWDFAVPVDTPVHAAAPGVVVHVRDDSTRHGEGATYREDANLVVVDHGGGLFTSYVHLAAGSAQVAPGDRVAAGAVLAATGLSGQLTGPHLHFQLENAWSHSVPARFIAPGAADGCDLAPETGDVVVAGEADATSLVGRGELSPLPSAAFEGFGVTSARGLPARLLHREGPLSVSGEAESGAADVVVLLLPPGGGAAVASWRFAVATDGRFAGHVDLRALPPGRYGLGAVAVAQGAPVYVEAAIRVTLR